MMFGFLKRKPKYEDHQVIIPGRNVLTEKVYFQVVSTFQSYGISYHNFVTGFDVDAFFDNRKELTFGVLRNYGRDALWELLVDDQVIATGEWQDG